MSATTLEDLPNELLLLLFRCLDVPNLFRAFLGQNDRIDQLLSQSSLHYQLDFRAVSKRDFHTTCEQYLPLIADRIQSLHLSNDDRTPHLPSIFLSNGFTVAGFQRLRSLSLYAIDIVDQLVQITAQCLQLPSLTRLSMVDCYFVYETEDIRCLLNQIWRLPKLTHWTFDRSFPSGLELRELSSLSSSIRCISMKHVPIHLLDLVHLFQFTPHLRNLATSISPNPDDEQDELRDSIPSMVSLKCTFSGSSASMHSFLKKLPRLSHLNLHTTAICLNGYQWETFLADAVPQLKVFHLRMDFRLSSLASSEEEVERTLNSYRTEFWLEQHRWFVQCHWDSSLQASLYTLPYSLKKFVYSSQYHSKSTYSEDRNSSSPDHRSSFNQKTSSATFAKRTYSPFDHLEDLELSLPLDEQFGCVFDNLDRLRSLYVKLPRSHCDYSQLQMIFDRAPHLYSLALGMDGWVTISSEIFQLKSPSIREIRFLNKTRLTCQNLNSTEYEAFVSSDLCLQCHTVLLGVEYRRDIVRLVQEVPHLQSLIVQSGDDELNPLFPSDTDELVQWLESDLPSTCSFVRDTRSSSVRLWIAWLALWEHGIKRRSNGREFIRLLSVALLLRPTLLRKGIRMSERWILLQRTIACHFGNRT